MTQIAPINWRGQRVEFNSKAYKVIEPGYIFLYPYYEFEKGALPRPFINHYQYKEDGTWELIKSEPCESCFTNYQKTMRKFLELTKS